MSTDMPGFQSFFSLLVPFCVGKISSIMVNGLKYHYLDIIKRHFLCFQLSPVAIVLQYLYDGFSGENISRCAVGDGDSYWLCVLKMK